MTRRSEILPLKINDETKLFAEVTHLGGEEDVAISDLNIDSTIDAIKGIASKIHGVLETVSPQEVAVEFGVKLAAKSGKVTGLLVEGSGDASFKISLKWKNSTES
ncbi:hypothetical protein EYS14_07195 [Alteromonadaceae bacterium M269]|nr:hypothetical protein EYS14_07195 [Alteromonadaceae bacterium M269]